MPKPTPPNPREYMPSWADPKWGDGVEKIEVLVAGEGNPIPYDLVEDPEKVQKLRDSPWGVFMHHLLGRELFEEFLQAAVEDEDDSEMAFGGRLTLDDLKLFSELYAVPIESLEIRLSRRQGLYLCGSKTHTEEEISAARKAYDDALARYKKSVRYWERDLERKSEEAREDYYSTKFRE